MQNTAILMMRRGFLNYLFFVLCLNGFGQSNLFDQVYSIYKNSEIRIGSEAYIVMGRSTVFEFFAQTPNFEQTMGEDLGYSMNFLFEMDTLSDSFTLRDASLVSAKTVFTAHCHCLPNHHDISRGVISGKKLNNGDWKVEINVISGSEPFEFPIHTSGIFKYKLVPDYDIPNEPSGQNEGNGLFDTITEFRYSSGHTGWEGQSSGSSTITIKNDSVYFEPHGMRTHYKFKLKDSDWRNLTNSVSIGDVSGNIMPAGIPESGSYSGNGIAVRTNKSMGFRKIPEGANSNLTELVHTFQGIECDHFIYCSSDTSFTIVSNANSVSFQCVENKQDFDPRAEISKSLTFDINKSKDYFSLKDSDLVQARTFVNVKCICTSNGTHAVTKGKITGVRQAADEWEIKINVVYYDDEGKGYPFKETGIYRYAW